MLFKNENTNSEIHAIKNKDFFGQNTFYYEGVLTCILRLYSVPVSYTHLDVYKRQALQHMYCCNRFI